MNLRPLVAICGTTGVGKSNLAIEIALHLAQSTRKHGWKGARIINADSMQVYSGMDIITNKVPESQRRGIDHLLMGFKAPGEQYVVGQWVQDALKTIEETYDREEIPIVVGGTSYWIQHLIFPNRLASDGRPLTDSDATPALIMSQGLQRAVDLLPPHLGDLFNSLPDRPPNANADPDAAYYLHNLLKALDPDMATRWHWKDTRKVLRNLTIIKESGRRASEIIAEQSNLPADLPRFRTLCFWLYAEPSVLETRLNERVDNMIEEGLIDEIRSLHQIANTRKELESERGAKNESSSMPDYTLGIYQSIGYKEFHKYLSSSEPSEIAFKEAVDRMKLSTRQYAKRQITWIRNKLLPAVFSANTDEAVAPTYLLDATALGNSWTTQVQNPAIEIIEDFLMDKDLPDPYSLSGAAREMLTIEKRANDPNSVLNARRKLICPTCTLRADRPFMIEEGREWDAHQKTRVHKRLAVRQAREGNISSRTLNTNNIYGINTVL